MHAAPQPEAATAPPSIWAVVLGYNGLDLTRATLRSLRAQTHPNLRVLFVDNGSRDGSAAAVLEEFPEAAVLQIPDNIGFARGCNAGMAAALQAGADQVLLLNNDVEMAPDLAEKLQASLTADPRAGLAIAKIYFFDHPKVIWSAGASLRGFPARLDLLSTPGPDDGRYDRAETLDFATLCCALIPRRTLEDCGLLHPDFFLLFEDYEFCARIRKRGHTIRFVPHAHQWHKVSRTIQHKKPGGQTSYWRGRSKALFCRLHPEYARICWPGYRLLAPLLLRLRGHREAAEGLRRGLTEARIMPLQPIPSWRDPLDGHAVLLRR